MTSPPALSADLELGMLMADAADELAMATFTGSALEYKEKSDGSPVTETDRAIEERLRSMVTSERPADGFLGEEVGENGTTNRRWVINGIDGTASFLAGEREWSTLIALEEDGTVLLGLVTAPALRRRWWAARGTGAWTQATDTAASTTVQRMTIIGASSLGEAAVGIWPPPARLSPSDLAIAARLAAAVRRTSPETDWTDATRSFSPILKPSTDTGTCHGALLVATGQLDAFLLLGVGPWDIAALVPIIEEAGGTYAELANTPSADTASALFTNTPASISRSSTLRTTSFDNCSRQDRLSLRPHPRTADQRGATSCPRSPAMRPRNETSSHQSG